MRVEETASLLEVLRVQLQLKGARYGCGAGQCGACSVLIDGRGQGRLPGRGREPRRQVDPHPGGARDAGAAASAADRVPGAAGRPVRLLPGGHPGRRQGPLDRNPDPARDGDRPGARLAPLPLRRAQPHHGRGGSRRERMREAGGMIPANLAANPRLDRWVGFETPGRGARRRRQGGVRPGRPDRPGADRRRGAGRGRRQLDLVNPETDRSPDEGLTVGSMSLETLRRGAPRRLRRGSGSVSQGRRPPTGLRGRRARHPGRGLLAPRRGHWPRLLGRWPPRWTSASRPAARRAGRPPDRHRLVGQRLDRLDLPAKLFGAAYLHDLSPSGHAARPGAAPARAGRPADRPRRGGDPARGGRGGRHRARARFRGLRLPRASAPPPPLWPPRSETATLGGRARPDAGSFRGGIAEGPARAKPSRSAIRRRKPSTAGGIRPATAGPTSPTAPSGPRAAWPVSRTAR